MGGKIVKVDEKMTNLNVFAYGSLMYPTVWEKVVSGHYISCRAQLDGYRRLQIRGETFPAVVKGKGRVRGVLYFNINPADMALLDQFEGDYYIRTDEQVVLDGGVKVPSVFYAFKEAYAPMLLEKEWNPDEFALSGIKEFMATWMADRFNERKAPNNVLMV